MIGLITNIESKLIDLIADRCADSHHKDFQPDEYEEALYRADRKIARKYQILNRILKFNCKIVTPPEQENNENYVGEQKNVDVELGLSTLHQEYKVLINQRPYFKGKQNALVSNASQNDSYTYYLYYGHNSWLFNYNPRTEDDDIIIFYTSGASVDNFDADTNQPIIPDKFEDERIRYALIEMAHMGIAKFKEDKKVKYIDILRLNNRGQAIDPNLTESKAFLTIQPYKYP